MKRLLIYLLLIISLVAIAAVVLLAPAKRKSDLTKVRGVAAFVDPQHYYKSRLVRSFFETDAGQGKVLFPLLIDPVHSFESEFTRQSGYIGPESCRECHSDFYNGFVETAHYRTSALPTPATMLGTYEEGKNQVTTKFEGLSYEITQEVDKFFQTVKREINGKEYKHKQEVDIVTGSGNHWPDPLVLGGRPSLRIASFVVLICWVGQQSRLPGWLL